MSPLLASSGADIAEVSIARQTILNESKVVFGYELFDSSALSRQYMTLSEEQLLFSVLSLVDQSTLAGKKTLFLHCTHNSLNSEHIDLIDPRHVVLQVPQLPIGQMDQVLLLLPKLQRMHELGYRLAFDYSVLTRAYEPWLKLTSFIKFNLAELSLQNVESLIRLGQMKSDAILIAEKVSKGSQHALVASLGVKLFQGHWFAEPVVITGQTLRPRQIIVLELISLVQRQASVEEISELLKHDPSITFNLLRFINSAGFGLRTEVVSLQHAVMLLGMKRLFKWASLLITTVNHTDTPPAVNSTAIVRARLMELLATEVIPTDEADNAFVTGLFSLLDTMLAMPMETVLSSVSLPASVTDALLHRSGALGALLNLCVSCETDDHAAFFHAATFLGLSSRKINAAHLKAITWAETIAP